jgi:hypothetical protein
MFARGLHVPRADLVTRADDECRSRASASAVVSVRASSRPRGPHASYAADGGKIASRATCLCRHQLQDPDACSTARPGPNPVSSAGPVTAATSRSDPPIRPLNSLFGLRLLRNLTSGRTFCNHLSYLFARAVDVRLGRSCAWRGCDSPSTPHRNKGIPGAEAH